MLVKTTDDWIVLAVIRAAASETDTPWIGDLQYLGSAFRKRQEVVYKAYRWIPRAAAHVEKRSTVTMQKVKNEFKDDNPALEGRAMVHWSDGKRCCDDLKGIKDGQVVIATRTYEEKIVKTPGLSRLPLIGSSFTYHAAEAHPIEKQLPLDDLLFIETQVELTPEQIALVNSH